MRDVVDLRVKVADLGEAIEVVLAHGDGEGVGHDGAAPHVDRAVVVHLPHETAAELDRAQAAAEDASEGPFDHVLE